jgi:phosphotransferase family enzyme
MAAGPKLGEGREAEVYAWGTDAVLKLYRAGYHGHRTEASVLAALHGSGVAPRLLDTVEADGRTGLVLQRLPGPDMLTLLQSRPWRVRALAHARAAAHLAIGRCEAPTHLPDLRQTLAARIDDAPLPPHLRTYTQQVLERLPDGGQLCHGDLHPGNALTDGARAAVIDWPNATLGDPVADHARTLLLLRWANPLPGTPLLFRALIAAGRTLTARLYTRAYQAGSPIPAQQLNRWLIVHAAARLSEGIDAETATLTRLIQHAQRTTRR